jgi:hypothetical protein
LHELDAARAPAAARLRFFSLDAGSYVVPLTQGVVHAHDSLDFEREFGWLLDARS